MLRYGSHEIGTWRKFARHVRSGGCHLLKNLGDFPNAVLVSGCQRSGTTMLARIIFKSEGMVDYWTGPDDELDAALILSGNKKGFSIAPGRYCFQTTYLNECFHEYFQHKGGFRLIWVLRNPYSVIHSMLYNWSRFALNELFEACGAGYLEGDEKRRYERLGLIMVGRARRACLAYKGKTMQLFEIKRELGDDVMVVDYDELVSDSAALFDQIYDFIDLPFKSQYISPINKKSIKKAERLPQRAHDMVSDICMPVYTQARSLLSVSPALPVQS